jgi:hypothetical protein
VNSILNPPVRRARGFRSRVDSMVGRGWQAETCILVNSLFIVCIEGHLSKVYIVCFDGKRVLLHCGDVSVS